MAKAIPPLTAIKLPVVCRVDTLLDNRTRLDPFVPRLSQGKSPARPPGLPLSPAFLRLVQWRSHQ